MLYHFLLTHRELLIERCSQQSRSRHASNANTNTPTETGPVDLVFGIAPFLDQLIKTLRVEQSRDGAAGQAVLRPFGGKSPKQSIKAEMGTSATRHGRELSDHGFTIDQVVHEYGDLCQVITGLAVELDAPIETEEFKTLNCCLDNGIADAVTEFSLQRDRVSHEREGAALNERLGVLEHELRNHLNTATLAFSLVKSGKVAVSGATGAVLERSLTGLRTLIDRSLAEVRLEAGLARQPQVSGVMDLIAEVKSPSA